MAKRLGWRVIVLAVLAGLLSAFVVACGDDNDDGGSEEERQEIADLAKRLASVNGFEADEAEIDFYMAHITDGFVQVFGTESVEACRENAAECIGEPLSNPQVDPESVEIDGDSATFPISSDEAAFQVTAIREDDEWKLDGLSVQSDEIPEGVDAVDLTLDEFAFGFDREDEHVTSGTFAFHVKNQGDQVHEVGMVKLPDDGDLLELLETDDPEAAGVEFITFKFPFAASDEADMAVPELAPGRYALVCFLPDTDDPEGTPHAFKGMTAEFSVE